jgi:hypothetical protein
MSIPYEVKVYLRNPIAAPKELKAIHPLGKVSRANPSQDKRKRKRADELLDTTQQAPVITDHGKAIA